MDRLTKLLFPAVLALLASPLMSGLITAFNLGLTEGFFAHWLKAWSVALPAALFVVYVVSPLARRVSAALALGATRLLARRKRFIEQRF